MFDRNILHHITVQSYKIELKYLANSIFKETTIKWEPLGIQGPMTQNFTELTQFQTEPTDFQLGVRLSQDLNSLLQSCHMRKFQKVNQFY